MVSVYQPAGEKTVQHIQTLSHLYQSAQDRAPGSPALSPSSFKICGIHVVDPSESRHGVQLLAVTTNGVRLYFSPASAVFSSYYGASSSSSSGGAQQLQLLHVRLPPTDLLHPDEQTTVATAPGQAQQQVGKSGPFTVSRLDYSCYHSGITLAAQQGDSEQRDFLMCLSPDLTRIAKLGQPQPPQPEGTATYTGAAGVISGPEKPGLVENATLLPIGGRTYGMAAAPRRSPHLTAYTPNELAVQFSEPPRNFVVLTNAGVVFMTKRRALDRMIAVLEDLLKDGNPNKIIEFRDRSVPFPYRLELTADAIDSASEETRPAQFFWVLRAGTRSLTSVLPRPSAAKMQRRAPSLRTSRNRPSMMLETGPLGLKKHPTVLVSASRHNCAPAN